jgi:phage-related protein
VSSPGTSSVPETFTYTSGLTGQFITLGDLDALPNVFVTGYKGLGLAPVDNFVVDTAYQPGALFVRTKKKTAVIVISLTIHGDPNAADQRADLWNTNDLILSILEPSILTSGTLVKTDSQGNQRILYNCQYVGGHEIDDKAMNVAYIQLDLIFEAYDPTWYSYAQHTAQIGAGTDPFGFVVPITVPLVVSGQAAGNATVTNAGNIYAQPVFTFQGPCQNFSLTNATTGESFGITKTLSAGDLLVVDTKAGSVTFTPAGGSPSPLYSSFGGNRQWVRLAPGANSLTFARDVAADQQCSIAWFDTWNHA